MLTTLIYRSQTDEPWTSAALTDLVDAACLKNIELGVTGILLFNGRVFFQVLEGKENILDLLFNQIRSDFRHHAVVELMRDYTAARRFPDTGMRLFDLRSQDICTVTDEVFGPTGGAREGLPRDDRVFRFMADFITEGCRYLLPPEFRSTCWKMEGREHSFPGPAPVFRQETPCRFALQPIVDPLAGEVVSYEALIRSPSGGSPDALFASLPAERHYHFDLISKVWALARAYGPEMETRTLAVNLLPGSLYTVTGAVRYLRRLLRRYNLRPEQLIIEVTESEIITCFDDFFRVLKQLREVGIGLAIDDFGAGYSGLSLLTKFQPDRIKIDMTLVRDIHLSGAKQAIVMSVIQCCTDLKITIVAEGVETLEEWCWLQSAGIRLFQGFLFSRPQMGSTGIMHWPVRLLNRPGNPGD